MLGASCKLLQKKSHTHIFTTTRNRNRKLPNWTERLTVLEMNVLEDSSIVNCLKDQPRTQIEISYKLNLPAGGVLTAYLDNLEKALFINSYVPYTKGEGIHTKKYKLTDEYLRFYFKYVKPNLKLISINKQQNLFQRLVKPVWQPWLGFAFENFCLKNAMLIAQKMGFEDQLINWGPAFSKKDKRFQVDLVYVCSDKVITICEIKYHDQLITAKVISDVENKANLITIPRGYTLEKALISKCGADDALISSGYFHHLLSVEDLF